MRTLDIQYLILYIYFTTDIPIYCTLPSSHDDSEMQSWIVREMRVRCHPTRLWVPCEYDREYDSFVPCPQELMNTLAEDYAITKNWCDFSSPDAEIKPLVMVDKGASDSFNKPYLARTKAVRIAFLITVYKDDALVSRLLSRLYGSEHYYLIHVDPAGASAEFTLAMRILAAKYPNVYISMDVPIVYGASTASILLSRAMAWYLKSASGWDYFMPLTGSDYPLLPLQRLEKILYSQEVRVDVMMVEVVESDSDTERPYLYPSCLHSPAPPFFLLLYLPLLVLLYLTLLLTFPYHSFFRLSPSPFISPSLPLLLPLSTHRLPCLL
jgi:Core-2/I-Branching enzyme